LGAALGAASDKASAYVASECPLAGAHILQGMEKLNAQSQTPDRPLPERAYHPIELVAKAYGLV
jgi:glycerol-3-phosphate dehydrogenase subunit C